VECVLGFCCSLVFPASNAVRPVRSMKFMIQVSRT
jgi:hypothetical protein